MIKSIFRICCVLMGGILVLLGLIVVFVTFWPSVGKGPTKKMRREYAKRNHLYYDGKFHNIDDVSLGEPKYSLGRGQEVVPVGDIPVVNIQKFPQPVQDKITITWFGHSCIMIQMDGKNILIDPALTKCASPFGVIGVKRFSKSPMRLEDIPTIDVMLISHDHYDHLDYKTIKSIDNRVKRYIVPLGVESCLEGWGVDAKKITTISWWENSKVNNVLITSVPARHYSMRSPFRHRSTLWCGFLLKTDDMSIYFTGDTGYTSSFQEVRKRFGHVDIFMGDSGQYNSAWRDVHMGPYDALKAAKDVDATYYMPIHWGSFALSNHNWFDPPEIATINQDDYGVKVITPRIGEIVDVKDIEKYTTRWWKE